MKKITLDTDTLVVESFPTGAETRGYGTVHGLDAAAYTNASARPGSRCCPETFAEPADVAR